ncbi:MAG: O-antigen ligase family protein, partial [Yaniella sp.]|nr:O-antigen ligase family protein [Yaniella sp.]
YSSYGFNVFSPYFVSPAVLIVGVLAGWYFRQGWRRGKRFELVVVVLVVTVLVIPIYANASAAVGGLFIALAGLAARDLCDLRETRDQPLSTYQSSGSDVRLLGQAIVLAVTLGIGIWLVLDSQAAIVLTGVFAVVMVIGLWHPVGPPRWIPVVFGSLVAAMAGLAVMWLASRASWPSWLAAGESLSSARHTLWSDALSLWATQPLFGAGPGAFTPSSELASSTPSLAAVHSLILQVGAELGAIGVVLLALVFVGGLVFAARGSRPVALIAMAAWTALAVHASIDHLEDFPIVGLMAGVILGWSGFNAQLSEAACRPANTTGPE